MGAIDDLVMTLEQLVSDLEHQKIPEVNFLPMSKSWVGVEWIDQALKYCDDFIVTNFY